MRSIVLAAAILLSVNAVAFDVDGLETGMSREKAISQLQSYGLTISSGNEAHIVARDANRMYYSLSFCEGRLVLVQKNLQPTFETFVQLISRFRSVYGAPVNVTADVPDPTSSAPAYNLDISWRDKAELITVKHISFGSNNQTYVTFEARNSCFKHPLLAQQN